MPVTGIRQEFQLTTRSAYSKVECELGIKVTGNELPNMAVLGDALENAIKEIQRIITESYVKVPERVS